MFDDFTAIDMAKCDLENVDAIRCNFATSIIALSKFTGCDLGYSNFTGADFLVTDMIDCSLDNILYAYATMPKDYDLQLNKPTVAKRVLS